MGTRRTSASSVLIDIAGTGRRIAARQQAPTRRACSYRLRRRPQALRTWVVVLVLWHWVLGGRRGLRVLLFCDGYPNFCLLHVWPFSFFILGKAFISSLFLYPSTQKFFARRFDMDFVFLFLLMEISDTCAARHRNRNKRN